MARYRATDGSSCASARRARRTPAALRRENQYGAYERSQGSHIGGFARLITPAEACWQGCPDDFHRLALTLPRRFATSSQTMNGKIRKICVYCGSGPGTDPAFVEAARGFGKILATNKIGLVYGGGAVGMMGEIAMAVLEHGGEVNGIIPEFLMAREHALR